LAPPDLSTSSHPIPIFWTRPSLSYAALPSLSSHVHQSAPLLLLPQRCQRSSPPRVVPFPSATEDPPPPLDIPLHQHLRLASSTSSWPLHLQTTQRRFSSAPGVVDPAVGVSSGHGTTAAVGASSSNGTAAVGLESGCHGSDPARSTQIQWAAVAVHRWAR
jgi:hypothetical protein